MGNSSVVKENFVRLTLPVLLASLIGCNGGNTNYEEGHYHLVDHWGDHCPVTLKDSMLIGETNGLYGEQGEICYFNGDSFYFSGHAAFGEKVQLWADTFWFGRPDIQKFQLYLVKKENCSLLDDQLHLLENERKVSVQLPKVKFSRPLIAESAYVDAISFGPPDDKRRGVDPVIQLNDQYAELADLVPFTDERRSQRDETTWHKLVARIHADQNVSFELLSPAFRELTIAHSTKMELLAIDEDETSLVGLPFQLTLPTSEFDSTHWVLKVDDGISQNLSPSCLDGKKGVLLRNVPDAFTVNDFAALTDLLNSKIHQWRSETCRAAYQKDWNKLAEQDSVIRRKVLKRLPDQFWLEVTSDTTYQHWDRSDPYRVGTVIIVEDHFKADG